MRIALRASVRLQAHSHHRILPQLVGRRAQSQHALPLRTGRLAHTHAAQIIVEYRPGVPLENLPTAIPIVTLALTAIVAAAVPINFRSHTSSAYQAPLQVVHRHMRVDLLQTQAVFHIVQLVKEILLRLQLARVSPHQLTRVPLLSLRSLLLQSVFPELCQRAFRNRPGHLTKHQPLLMMTAEIRPR